MLTSILETEEAKHKHYARYDAERQNAINRSTFSKAQQMRAERLLFGLQCVYNAKASYINWRKTQATVKLEAPYRVRDARELLLLERELAAEGIVKKLSQQGVIYAIKKAK